MSFSPSQASGHDDLDHAKKRPRLDNADTPATAFASQRFFRTPELVNVVLEHLTTERIDLLTLSLVSKALRLQALRAWVKHLDIPIAAGEDRIKFLKANPVLFDHVRYLRLQSWDPDEGLDFPSENSACCVNELLQLITQHSTSAHTLPLIDLTIFPSDTIRLPTPLAQRVTALRVPAIPNDHNTMVMRPSQDSDGTDRDSSHQESPEARTWRKIADIIQQAADGPGLRVFFLEDDEITLQTDLRIWQQLVRHAPTLRELDLSLCGPHFPDQLARTAFDRLETFNLNFHTSGQVSLIEDFLDGAPNLRHVVIWLDTGERLSLRQTFPHLHRMLIPGPIKGVDERESFDQRHPNMVVLQDGSIEWSTKLIALALTPPSSSSTPAFYLNLGRIVICIFHDLQRHLEAGHLFAHVALSGTGPDTAQRCLPALYTHFEAAQRLTCLELSLPLEEPCDRVYRYFIPLLGSENFPHMTELHLLMPSSWPEPLGQHLRLEAVIGRLMKALTPARSLKVLQVSGRIDWALDNDILHNHEFPPSLEYFCFRDVNSIMYGPTLRQAFFRFLPCHPEAYLVETISGGQRGRLQRIPARFRTRITKDGVWQNPPREESPTMTVLDHPGEAFTHFLL